MDYLAVVAVLCAFVVKGMYGFANTLILGTIMGFRTSNLQITPLDLLLGYPSNLFIAWKERKAISLKVCLPLSLMVVAGGIPGALFLISGNIQLIKALFGVAVIAIGIEMLLRERKKVKRSSTKVELWGIGILSGFLCGLFGIGAFLVAYISRTTENQKQFRGNICAVFLIENTFRVILYSVTGVLNGSIVNQAVFLMPFMVAGLAIGVLLSKHSSEKLVKKAIIVLLMLSGISLIINNLRF